MKLQRSLAMLLPICLVGCVGGGGVDMDDRDFDLQSGTNTWELIWADEFDGPAGASPDPAKWNFETGDGSDQGMPGWGNKERQYYTDDPANAATDGEGHLLITVRRPEEPLDCYYGPCEYTSARLNTLGKAEFTYGRIEARIRVPAGQGVWAAFWSLGADFREIGWPQCGEIDFMEFVGRLPTQVYGTLHGPGYTGGESFGGSRDLADPLSERFVVHRVDWEPGRVKWYVDGALYHSATPEEVPGPWVYEKPMFLILNLAMGGYFGGDTDPNLALPLSMAVDYVRVYRATGSP